VLLAKGVDRIPLFFTPVKWITKAEWWFRFHQSLVSRTRHIASVKVLICFQRADPMGQGMVQLATLLVLDNRKEFFFLDLP
jgi:hypothetical protein